MFKKLFYAALFLLIIISNSYSQNSSISNSKKFTKAEKYSYSDIDKLLDSANISIKTNSEEAFNYIETAMILSINSKRTSKRAKVFEALASYYEHFKQHNLAAINYEKSAQFYGAKNSADYYRNSLLAAQQFFKAKEYQKSISLYKKLLKARLDKKNKLLIYEGLGDNYFATNNNKLALSNYKLADKLSKGLSEIDKNTEIKLKIANVLKQSNDKATLDYLKDANVQSSNSANERLQLQSQNQIADFYSSNKMFEEEIKSRALISNTLEQKSEILKKQDVNVTEENFRNNTYLAQRFNYQNQPNQALKYIKKNKKLKQEEVGIEFKIEAAKTQSEAYAELGQGNKAIES